MLTRDGKRESAFLTKEIAMDTTTAIKKMSVTEDQLKQAKLRIKLLEVQISQLIKAGQRVLSDIDDDGVAERHDMGVLALRKAVELGLAGKQRERSGNPSTAHEVIEFIGSNYESMETHSDDGILAEEDIRYLLTVHDILSAFSANNH
jgi:hypothetical protein